MVVNRDLWESPFYTDSVPPWPCPRCHIGTLELRDRQWLLLRPNAESRARGGPDYASDGEDEQGAVCCLVDCNRKDCGETCSVSGYYYTEMRYFEGEPSPVPVCWPRKITPSPRLIHIPRDCPKDVAEEVISAFRVFFCDHGACLNHIRQAIELLLTEMGVPRAQVVTKGGAKKHIRRSLHNRILWLKGKRPKLADMCDQLMAVKHLGNAGSHPGLKVEGKDVFDGFDILETILAARYGKADTEFAKMVREINRRQGPRKTTK